MAIDLSDERVMIFDNNKARANLVWNEDEVEIEARGLWEGKKVLAFGEEEILRYFSRR